MCFCPPAKAVPIEGSSAGDDMIKQDLDDWLIADGPMHVRRILPLLYRAAEVLYEQATEAYLAREMAAKNTSHLAYSPGHGWMVWNGIHWKADATSNTRYSTVGTFASELRGEGEKLSAEHSRVGAPQGSESPQAVSDWLAPLNAASGALMDGYKTLSKLHDVKATLELAQPDLLVADDRWAREPLLLGVRNGNVDLQTGLLSALDPSAYITRCADAEYDPEARCPEWLHFLDRVQPVQEDRASLQRLAGFVHRIDG